MVKVGDRFDWLWPCFFFSISFYMLLILIVFLLCGQHVFGQGISRLITRRMRYCRIQAFRELGSALDQATIDRYYQQKLDACMTRFRHESDPIPRFHRFFDPAVLYQSQYEFHYKQGPMLGGGAYGMVYLSRDHRTGEDVAVKVSHPHTGEDIEHEYKSLCTIHSRTEGHEGAKHVIRPLECFKDQEKVMMVMPLREGNLRDILSLFAIDYHWDYRGVQQIVNHVVKALDCLNEAGYAHCDIKPLNVMVQSSRAEWELVDFGSATVLRDRPRGWTPFFLPPGYDPKKSAKVDPTMDMWALGLTILTIIRPKWTMDELDRLINAWNPSSIIERWVDDKAPRDASQTHKHLLTNFISGCLETNRLKRLTPLDALKHPFLSN